MSNRPGDRRGFSSRPTLMRGARRDRKDNGPQLGLVVAAWVLFVVTAGQYTAWESPGIPGGLIHLLAAAGFNLLGVLAAIRLLRTRELFECLTGGACLLFYVPFWVWLVGEVIGR